MVSNPYSKAFHILSLEANISIARDEATRNRTYIRTDRIKDRGAKVNGKAICNIFYIFVTHLSDVSTKMMNVRDPFLFGFLQLKI